MIQKHPFSGDPASEQHDVDLGDDHWLDWSTYEGERCGGIITHRKSAALLEQQRSEAAQNRLSADTVSTNCQGAFTICGSIWHQKYPERASWEFDGNVEQPTLSPSFLCHCGDHGFVRQGRWVRA